MFGIWQTGVEKHCGTVRLSQIESHNRTAYIGVCLFDRQVWGLGIGARAVRIVTEWAFESLKLRGINAGIDAGNRSSEKAFRAAGYEWFHDIADKYLLDGEPTLVRFFIARNPQFFSEVGASA